MAISGSRTLPERFDNALALGDLTMANPPGSSRAYRTTIVPGIMVPWTRQSY
jgi:hypothetical protein